MRKKEAVCCGRLVFVPCYCRAGTGKKSARSILHGLRMCECFVHVQVALALLLRDIPLSPLCLLPEVLYGFSEAVGRPITY